MSEQQIKQGIAFDAPIVSEGTVDAAATTPMRRGPTTLPWKPQGMVRWFSPGELASAGMRAVLSAVFGEYADRRELQAALHDDDVGAAEPHDYSARTDTEDGFWIDYVADLGDGFRSTYTVAWLLAQPTLPASGGDATPVPRERSAAPRAEELKAGTRTRRGHVLVMGGDQVYPTASREEYTNRMSGPYEAALPWHGEGEAPHLFAIPGNHDWYDGLTAFIRLFTQKRWIGGWGTQQSRSYWALKLPERWWLLGIDVQLAADIDQPQMDYFCRVAERMQPGDRVILCTAEPAWVHTRSDPRAFDNLAFFEKQVLAPRGAELALTLTGDLHHYARYSSPAAEGTRQRHKITAGGGGAYLLGTQLLPADIELDAPVPPAEAAAAAARVGEDTDHSPHRTETWTRGPLYPGLGESLRLKLGAWKLFWKNPSFAVFLGVVYALFAWFVQSASQVSAVFDGVYGDDFMEAVGRLAIADLGEIAGLYLKVAMYSPSVVALTLLFIAGMGAFTAPDVERSRFLVEHTWLRRVFRWGLGTVHGVAHIALVVGLMWAFSVTFSTRALDASTQSDPVISVGFLAAMVLGGGLLGSLLMSLFLLPFVNYNEAFSAQHLESHKNFVRLRIDRGGDLTVYAYGVDAPGTWRFHPDADPGEPYFDAAAPPRVRLVDGPLTIAGAHSAAPLAETPA